MSLARVETRAIPLADYARTVSIYRSAGHIDRLQQSRGGDFRPGHRARDRVERHRRVRPGKGVRQRTDVTADIAHSGASVIT